MTKHRDLPENAIQAPTIETPAQDAERAARRADREEWRAEHGILSDPASPRDPLRQPGESSSRAEDADEDAEDLI